MSIVEGPDSGAPPKDRPKLGWLVALVLLAVNFLIFGLVSSTGDDAVEAMARRADAAIWWADFNVWGFVGFIVPVLGLIFIPGAFGSRIRQVLPPMPRFRWLVVGAVALLCLGFDVACYFTGGKGGYATEEAAVFVSGGRVASRQPWADAKRVRVACDMEGKHDTNPVFHYVVFFNSGGPAQLADRIDAPSSAEQGMSAWLRAVRPIDDELNDLPSARSSDFFSGEPEAKCMSAYDAILSDTDRRAFHRLFTHPGQ